MAVERFTVRPARPDDAEPLIVMMRALAAFEGYLPRFRVTAGDRTPFGKPAARGGTHRRRTWLVLPSNDAAKRLYRRFGGAPDTDWEHWRVALPGLT